jgi:hypothetical protein
VLVDCAHLHHKLHLVSCRCRYYVEAQERELLGILDSLAGEESWRPADEAAGAGVLRSASQLFGEIKKSLVRCSKYITRGPALLQLMTTFQVGMLDDIRHDVGCSLQFTVQGYRHLRPGAAATHDERPR